MKPGLRWTRIFLAAACTLALAGCIQVATLAHSVKDYRRPDGSRVTQTVETIEDVQYGVHFNRRTISTTRTFDADGRVTGFVERTEYPDGRTPVEQAGAIGTTDRDKARDQVLGAFHAESSRQAERKVHRAAVIAGTAAPQPASSSRPGVNAPTAPAPVMPPIIAPTPMPSYRPF